MVVISNGDLRNLCRLFHFPINDKKLDIAKGLLDKLFSVNDTPQKQQKPSISEPPQQIPSPSNTELAQQLPPPLEQQTP